MQRLRLPNRWQYSLIAVLGTVVCVSLVSWHRLIANDPPASTPTPNVELAESVDVNVPSFLRVAGRHTYAVPVRITNTSEEPLRGPLYLVVEGTNIETLGAQNADGTTPNEEPYFQYLSENDSLAPEKPSLTRKLQFKSDSGALRSEQRKGFKLDYRLTRDVSEPAVRSDRLQAVQGPAEAGHYEPSNRNRGSRTPNRESGDDDPDNPPGADAQSNETPDDDSAKKQPAQHEPFTPRAGITDEAVQRAMAVQEKATPGLIKKDGVHGTATGINQDGELVIRVYVERDGIASNLPEQLEGLPVEVRVTGKVRPYFYQPPQDKRGQAGQPKPRPPVADPTQRFSRPVPIGVSAFNGEAQEAGVCATGTLGCRLRSENGILFALSNNHVFARSTGVDPDDNAVGNAQPGDRITQPGCLDLVTLVPPGLPVAPPDVDMVREQDVIGELAAFVPLNFIDLTVFPFRGRPNRVDAAIAEVTADAVSQSSPSGAYGPPRTEVVEPRLGMKVQKMGRTTVYTTGRLVGLNVTILVGYSNGIALFEDQIEFTNPVRVDPVTGVPSFEPFGGPGDSGSLIVTNPSRHPVGLLFAGSADQTRVFANPIDAVLSELESEIGQTLQIDGR